MDQWLNRSVATALLEKSNMHEHVFDVSDILNKCPKGRSMEANFKIKNRLNDIIHKILIHVIADYFIDYNIKLTLYLCNQLSESIVSLFPKEEKETYYLWRV